MFDIPVGTALAMGRIYQLHQLVWVPRRVLRVVPLLCIV